MDRELARYLTALIDNDLRFSFNGMGLPSSACEWIESQFLFENYTTIKEFIDTRYRERKK